MKSNVVSILDKMKAKELKRILDSSIPEFIPYLNYVKLKLEERTIIEKYLRAA